MGEEGADERDRVMAGEGEHNNRKRIMNGKGHSTLVGKGENTYAEGLGFFKWCLYADAQCLGC